MKGLHAPLILLLMAGSAQAAVTYRTTITTRIWVTRPPTVQRIVADGDRRRLIVEHQGEPFEYDVLLSADGGRSITALNTPLHTWYALSKPPATATRLPPSMRVEIRDAKTEVTEEGGAEPIAGYPVRKFVVHVSYTTRETFGGTSANRVHTMTALVWTTDKLDRALAFPPLTLTVGVESIDADLVRKTASVPGFPLRVIATVSRAYEGGPPVVEMKTKEVDDVRAIPAAPESLFVRPEGYVNQEPIIGGVVKTTPVN